MKPITILILIFAAGLYTMSVQPLPAYSQTYESYYRYVSQYPYQAKLTFSEELQGVTHDSDNWYFTQKEALWKIPVECDLNGWDNCSKKDQIIKVDLGSILTALGLDGLGYNHLGDLSYHDGYLFIPLEGEGHDPKIIVIKASNLDPIGHADLIKDPVLNSVDGSWCEIQPKGNFKGSLFTSPTFGKADRFLRYEVDWNLLKSQPPVVKITWKEHFLLYDIFGNPLKIAGNQGASFSENGNLLFVATGDTNRPESDCAIHAFELKTDNQTGVSSFRRIRNSSQDGDFFRYECHPGWYEDESEGVDIWDLDNGRAPGIRGQLHVIQLDLDYGKFEDGIDKLYFHHYTGNIYVDKNYSGGNGKIDTPFSNVADAYNYIVTNNWYEARIKIKTGNYHESLQISSMPLQMTGWQGNAKVGVIGQISLSPSGAISIFNNGELKTY